MKYKMKGVYLLQYKILCTKSAKIKVQGGINARRGINATTCIFPYYVTVYYALLLLLFPLVLIVKSDHNSI